MDLLPLKGGIIPSLPTSPALGSAFFFHPMTDDLTDKQRRFVQEYLVNLNATQAAIRAAYSDHITAASRSEPNSSTARNSSRTLPWNDSAYPFSHGDTGAMYSTSTARSASHRRTARAMNSGPLSLRM
jgi:hypothetical protein